MASDSGEPCARTTARREAGHETEDWLQAEAELPSERIKPLAGETVKTTRKPMSEKRNEKCYAVEDQRFFGEDGYAEEGNKPGGGGKLRRKVASRRGCICR